MSLHGDVKIEQTVGMSTFIMVYMYVLLVFVILSHIFFSKYKIIVENSYMCIEGFGCCK